MNQLFGLQHRNRDGSAVYSETSKVISRAKPIICSLNSLKRRKLCRPRRYLFIGLNIKCLSVARFAKNCAATVPQPCHTKNAILLANMLIIK